MREEIRIYLEAVSELPGGWYGGECRTTNRPIYMRTNDKEEALVFHPHEAFEIVGDFCDSGYPCRCVPCVMVKR